MTIYDPEELKQLYVRCKAFLGAETFERVVNSPPRWSGFVTSLEADIKVNDGDLSKIQNRHFGYALEIALEIWPYEAEAVAKHFYKGEAS
jgi:hypothetical protein